MSLKKNFFYSSLLTVSNYMFPMLVYPYVSRVLGVSNIGVVNFVDNLVNYFIIFSMMGIMAVGIRETAASEKDRRHLSQTFMSLFSLTAITTIAAIVVLFVAMNVLPVLIPHKSLLTIGIVKLFFNLFLIEWFYMGIENFKYITYRSILVRSIYVASVFLFVKTPSDYHIYYLLTVATIVVNAIINVAYSLNYVDYNFHLVKLRLFSKPFITMGLYMVLTNFYTSFNVVWLGLVTNTDEVGYFTTATKLHTIIMAVLLSFANILFPRMSSLLAEGKREEYFEKISISFDAIFLFAFPTLIFLLVAGPDLLRLIVGAGYEGAYLSLRIISPLVLVIGAEQILVMQILIAMHQDKTVLCNSLLGAATALLCNIAITSESGAAGAAVAWCMAEICILVVSAFCVQRDFHYTIPYKRLSAYAVAYTPLLILSIFIYYFMDSSVFAMPAVALITVLYSLVNEIYILRNKVAIQLYSLISNHCHRMK